MHEKAKEISFKFLTPNHFAYLHKWMLEPHIRQWWGDKNLRSLDDIHKKYTSYTLGYKLEGKTKKEIFPYIIFCDSAAIGYIQFYNVYDFPRDGVELKSLCIDEGETSAALDFYIGDPTYLGKNLGSQILKSFLKNYVFKKFQNCLVDPEKDNIIAIKAYTKSGFEIFQALDTVVVMIAKG